MPVGPERIGGRRLRAILLGGNDVFLATDKTIEETIELFASLGVEVHITELDISLYTSDNDSYDPVPEEVLVRQGYRYKDIFDVLKRQAWK